MKSGTYLLCAAVLGVRIGIYIYILSLCVSLANIDILCNNVSQNSILSLTVFSFLCFRTTLESFRRPNDKLLLNATDCT